MGNVHYNIGKFFFSGKLNILDPYKHLTPLKGSVHSALLDGKRLAIRNKTTLKYPQNDVYTLCELMIRVKAHCEKDIMLV